MERLTKESGLLAPYRRHYKGTTDLKHGLPIAEHTPAHNFMPAASVQVWTLDIACLWADEGWLYLAIVLDPLDREVVGQSLRPCMTADIVTDALTMAWFQR